MNDKKVIRSFAMISHLSITMMVPVFLCCVLGNWLNEKFHSDALFLLIMLTGIGAALRNMFVLTKSFCKMNFSAKSSQQEEAYIQELKDYRKEHPDEDFSDVMKGKKKRYPDNSGPTRH